MIEISVIILSLLIEAYVILLIGAITWLYFASRKKKNDRNAAVKLVDQIKHQSETRLTTTGSFLEEKYHFEGHQLKKAVASIDKAEKRFFQKVIDMYLQRDAEAFSKLDADVAELIETYKELTPAIKVENVVNDESEKDAQIEQLKKSNEQLTQELEITNKTISDMIGEFGNMFGGGKDNELEQREVVKKVISKHDEDIAANEPSSEDIESAVEEVAIDEVNSESLETDEIAIEGIDFERDETQPSEIETEPEKEEEGESVTSEADIDDILNGIISPDQKKPES